MFDSTPRLVGAIVAACVVLSLLALMWSRQPEPDSGPKPGSVGMKLAAAKPTRTPLPSGDTWSSVDTHASGAAPQLPRKLAQPGEHTVPSEGGRRLAAERLPERDEPQGRRGANVVQYGAGGGRQAGVAGGDGGGNAARATPVLPPGTKLAVPLLGNATTADESGPIEEENVYYDKSEDGAFFAPDARMSFGDNGGVQNEQGTIAFWIKPDWNGADPTDNSMVQLRTGSWSNRLQVFKNGPFLRFLFTDDTGVENNVGIDIRGWQAGEWHHVAATWADSVTTLYVDGAERGQGNYQGKLDIPAGTPLYVGSDLPNGTPGANAVLRSFMVFDHAMTADEIIGLYENGPA